eukprot:TRINITY_DN372_c0_g1_i1.p1 TRINITY_DN372_c0_g1~~TRINITY_DN372_c0_g1_i1.p1  ORF type:complete len:234 (+),score=38.71 TRINITY_DN372_c0_g1_i1:70-771(+)
MADGYWRYGDVRPPPPASMPFPAGKRPRSDYDIPGGYELPSYFSHGEERGGHRATRDIDSIGASYDRYLRSGQISSFGAVEPSRSVSGGMTGSHLVDDPRMMGVGGMDPGMAGKGQNLGFGGGRPEIPLPPDASNTLFVEGLPSNCTQREVSHIFRPFVGFKEVRLVSKESRHRGESLVLCFIDFSTPGQAAIALDALQGYKFDEHDRESPNLRLQFARFPGPRSGGGPRGRR